MLKQYETVFILTPVLSEVQMKEAVAKFHNLIVNNGGEIVYEEDWGLRKLAYPIQKKTTGFYSLIGFKAEPDFIGKFELQYRRDERVIRYSTMLMDKHAIAYADKKHGAGKSMAPSIVAEPVIEVPIVDEPELEEKED